MIVLWQLMNSTSTELVFVWAQIMKHHVTVFQYLGVSRDQKLLDVLLHAQRNPALMRQMMNMFPIVVFVLDSGGAVFGESTVDRASEWAPLYLWGWVGEFSTHDWFFILSLKHIESFQLCFSGLFLNTIDILQLSTPQRLVPLDSDRALFGWVTWLMLFEFGVCSSHDCVNASHLVGKCGV